MNEVFNAIVAAIRNPDNSNNLILVEVQVENCVEPTMAICWKDDVKIQPMALIVTPELFQKVKIDLPNNNVEKH